MKNRGEKWTTEEITLTKDLYRKGVGISEIVSYVNHSESGIQKKIKELGFTNRRNDWTESDIENLKKLFNKNLSYSEIAKELNKTVRACQAKAIRLGLKKKDCNTWKNNKRADFWTEKDIEKLIYCAENYSSYSEISKIIGRSVKSISCKLSELGKHLKEKTEIEKANYRRSYSVTDDYFETIDSQKKAYWLGWLITDGFITTNLNTNRGLVMSNSIGLKLQEKDSDVLKDMKADLNCSKTIRTVKRNKPIIYNDKTIISKTQCELRFTSAKMIQDLARYGIHQNKTYDVTFPKELDSKYYPGFIAGVISGDGCIDIKKNRNTYILRCTIAGNLDLVQNIHSILVKEIGVNADKKIFRYEHTAQLYRLELNQTETIALYNWLQKNGISLMERKNKLIEEFINERVKIPA